MGTKITIETDDPTIVAGIAELMTGKRAAPVVDGAKARKQQAAMDTSQIEPNNTLQPGAGLPIGSGGVAPVVQQATPPAPPVPAQPAQQAAAVPPPDLAAGVKAFLSTKGNDPNKLRRVMMNFTNVEAEAPANEHDKLKERDGSWRCDIRVAADGKVFKKSVNWKDVPPENVAACAAALADPDAFIKSLG